MHTYNSLPPSTLSSLRSNFPNHHFIGLDQSEPILRFIWENLSAIAGDQPSLECWPPPISPLSASSPHSSARREEQQGKYGRTWSLHEILLAGWGCPIGELFDLEKLAEYCEQKKRWSFFVSGEVCNVLGGVARYVLLSPFLYILFFGGLYVLIMCLFYFYFFVFFLDGIPIEVILVWVGSGERLC